MIYDIKDILQLVEGLKDLKDVNCYLQRHGLLLYDASTLLEFIDAIINAIEYVNDNYAVSGIYDALITELIINLKNK